MKKFNGVWVHDSMRAESMSQKRRESLFGGEVHQGFHYMSHRQAQLWMEVHKRHAPLFRDPEFVAIFEKTAADIASELAGQGVHVIGVGAGGGEKEALVLSALKASGCQITYTPLDVSLELALSSAEAGAMHVSGEIRPVVGDLSALDDISVWPGDSGQTKVFTFFGIAPNMMPTALGVQLAKVLRPQDVLLLSANLAPIFETGVPPCSRDGGLELILPQYDNSETRRWLKQILVDWGISGILSEPAFEVQRFGSVWGISASCSWLSSAEFEWEGKVFESSEGGRLRLFYSLRYSVENLRSLLRENVLDLTEGYTTPCKQEGVWRVRRRKEP